MKRPVLAAALIALLGACTPPADGPSDEPDQQTVTLSVSELAATEGSPSAPFGTINDMLEVAPGVVAIADDVLHRLHSWTIATGVVARLARRGPGPGEVETPMQLARRPSGGFALYDVGQAAIHLYDSDFEHERTAPGIGTVSYAKDFVVLSDGSFVLAGGRLSDPRHLHRFSSSGDRMEAWGEPAPGLSDPVARIQAAGGALRRMDEGGFLFSFGAPLRVVRFAEGALGDPRPIMEDLNTRPELTENELYRPGSRPGTRVFQWWFDRTSAILVLEDGNLLNILTRFYQGDSVWDLYSPNGHRVARTVVGRAYYVHDITVDGTIVAHYRDPETDERIAVVLALDLTGG